MNDNRVNPNTVNENLVFDKAALIKEVVQHLRDQEHTLQRAADAAREAATHEEAKPENDKDTRALEASYLSGGQARKAAELAQARNAIAFLTPRNFAPNDPADVTAVVTIQRERDRHASHYLLLPYGGGLKLQGGVQVLATASPLAQALLGKRAGEECDFNRTTIEIVAVH